MKRSGAMVLAVLCLGSIAVHAEKDGVAGRRRDERLARPNIVFILTDDLAWDLVPYMPHVVALQRAGVTFSRYYVSDSLCCPSRSSIFTGKFPHDTGVFTNSGTDGGYATFLAHGNERETFATALRAAGYQTAFMGKYLNGYEPTMSAIPEGWSEWDAAGNGYPEFDYDLNQNGQIVHHGHAPGDYLTDVVARLGVEFINRAAVGGQPFLLEIATFAPHAPYVPAPRNANDFPGLGVPRTPAFGARPGPTAPEWLRDIPALGAPAIRQLDADFRLRAQAVEAVDELIGALEQALAANGLENDTYVFFSSDNGYHMGDHSLRAGKMTAFDTDIRVPLIVAGPGVPAGVTVEAIAQNIDLCPTFEGIGRAPIPPAVEGRSLLPLLHGHRLPEWRDVALIEHHGPVEAADDPDLPDEHSGNPTRYESIRIPGAVYVEYATGEREYHDLASDPFELDNTAGALSPARLHSLHETLAAVRNCHDGASCRAAQHLRP